jgi:hypothetical protein
MNERAITELRLGRNSVGRVVRKLCELGATTKDLAEVFAVSEEEMDRQLRGHNDFSQAASDGRIAAIDNISNALLRRATGMNVKQRRIVSVDGVAAQIVVEQDSPPDLKAANAVMGDFRKRPEIEAHHALRTAKQMDLEDEAMAALRGGCDL